MNKNTFVYNYIVNLYTPCAQKNEHIPLYKDLFFRLTIVFDKTEMFKEWLISGTLKYPDILIKWLENVKPSELTSEFTGHEIMELFTPIDLLGDL